MPVPDEILSDELLDQVLERFGFAARPDPTLAGLRDLFAAWNRQVPFDNVRKMVALHEGASGPLPGATAAGFFTAWLRDGAGGTCWAVAGALHALLAALRFRAERGVATMMVAPDIPPNHGTVVVRIDAACYAVDPSILHHEPLRLDQGARIEHGAWGAETALADGQAVIRWRPPRRPQGLDCRIDQLGVDRAQFAALHERTRRWSPFNFELYAQTHRSDTTVASVKGRRIVRDASGVESETPFEGAERLRWLVDVLGIAESLAVRLPPDRATPPPPVG